MKNKSYQVNYSFKYLFNNFVSFVFSLIKGIFKSIWKLLLFLTVIILIFGSAILAAGGYFYLSTVGEIPKLEDPSKIALPQNSTIYDVDDNIIGVITSQRRYLVAGNEINNNMKNALVAIEDERYFNHDGIDFIGIGRALYTDYQSWRTGGKATVQGASTITQQYVKMVYLNPEQSIKRKLQEITLSVELESQLSKQDILDKYLNVVYFGNGSYGVEAASQYYFSKSAKNLTVPESAILAAIVKSPTKYDPTTEKGKEFTFERATVVLNKMYQLGYISRSDLLGYKAQDFNLLFNIKDSQREIYAPYYYDFVMKELLTKYSKEEIYTGGWEIHTTLSIKKANIMKDVISSAIGKGSPTAAMTDINPQTGAINAFWGGFDYQKSNFNLATQGRRQPGSSFKPFVYATAFKQGMRNDSSFSNAPITLKGKNGKPWSIKPDSHARTLEQGLAYSDNAMAVRLISKTGINPVIKTAHDLGITSSINDDAAIALGGLTYGVSTLEMANAYATFANKGVHNTPYCIESITNSLGDKVYSKTLKPEVVINTEIAAMMNKALQGVVKYGTAANSVNLKYTREIAGKTGTTDDHADTWFIGYTPNFTAAVWIGYPNTRKPIKSIRGQQAWGGTFSAKIWNDYAKIILKGKPAPKFSNPKGVVEVPKLEDVKSLEQLKQKLAALGLFYQVKEVADDNHPENTVISIEDAGNLVPLHSSITISMAVHKYTVPDFIGKTPFEAVSMANNISSNGFVLQFKYEVDDKITADQSGTIFGQSIAAGGRVDKGSPVILTLKFQTPPPVTVIKKVPTPYVPTDSELYDLQQQINTLNERISALTADNNKLSGDLANEKGSLKLLTPNFVGMDYTSAKLFAESMGFNVIVHSGSGTVISQSIPAGSVPTNSNITLTGTP